jgi:3-oxoacyl-(acyl-carrier-protein) synthase
MMRRRTFQQLVRISLLAAAASVPAIAQAQSDARRQARYGVSVGSGQPGTGVPVQSAGFGIDRPEVLPK